MTAISRVALLAEGVDRNFEADGGVWKLEVALLAEGVDRNGSAVVMYSASSGVALLAEGVDRNYAQVRGMEQAACRPPRGGRG